MRYQIVVSVVLIWLLAATCTAAGEEFVDPAGDEFSMWRREDFAPANPDRDWKPRQEYNGELSLYKNHIDSFKVPAARTATTYSNIVLEEGENYIIRVSGTAYGGDTIDLDAKYSITHRIKNDVWTDTVTGYESYGIILLELLVDGGQVEWGEYNQYHVYHTMVTGNGAQLGLLIYDFDHSDNKGSLLVEIYPHP